METPAGTPAAMPAAAAIRLANARDIPAILEIYNEAVRTRTATADLAPQSLEDRISWFAARDMRRRPVLVAEEDGETVAWGAFTDFKPRAGYAPTAEVSVYVAARAAGRGVGRTMLDALLTRAAGCRIDRALALCFEHNEASLRLFRSRGFEEWGRLREACDMDGTRRSVVILGWSA